MQAKYRQTIPPHGVGEAWYGTVLHDHEICLTQRVKIFSNMERIISLSVHHCILHTYAHSACPISILPYTSYYWPFIATIRAAGVHISVRASSPDAASNHDGEKAIRSPLLLLLFLLGSAQLDV